MPRGNARIAVIIFKHYKSIKEELLADLGVSVKNFEKEISSLNYHYIRNNREWKIDKMEALENYMISNDDNDDNWGDINMDD